MDNYKMDSMLCTGEKVEIIGKNYSGQFTKTRVACRCIVLREMQERPTDNEILLTCETLGNKWMLPGGGVEGTETEQECCIREVAEETGVLIKPSTCRLEIDEYYEECKWINRYFFAEPVGLTSQNLTEAEKKAGLRARWVPVDEALQIFSEYRKYEGMDEEKSGMLYREHIALTHLL